MSHGALCSSSLLLFGIGVSRKCGLGMQFTTCLSKNMMVYWRNTEYNAVRLFSTCFLAFLFGSIYWGLGDTR